MAQSFFVIKLSSSKKWYEKLQQISNVETRSETLWAIIEYLATDRKTLGCMQRFKVFCDMFTRFISGRKRVLTVVV